MPARTDRAIPRGFVAPLAAALLAGAPTPATTQTAAGAGPASEPEAVTWARDVAPIVQEKCQECHTAGSIAPFALDGYDDVRRRARRIRPRLERRIMPPWHINRTVGIQDFQNDRGLSDEELATLLAWMDAGMPYGEERDLPPPREPVDYRRWRLEERFGPPDLVVESPPFTLPAETQDKWYRPLVETGLTEARWARAIEIKPSFPWGRRIVHHALTFLEQDEDGVTGLASAAAEAQTNAGLFMEWAVGKVGEVFPDDAGKLMLPGARVRWEIHMHAIGEEVAHDRVQLGVWFHPKGYVPRHRTVLRMLDARGESGLDIPPGTIAVTQQHHVLAAPARLENFQPHMHMRGKAMSLEAIYPDGRKEPLSLVDRFQWNWHNNYIYADDSKPLLPAGTTLVVTAWHDNTADNPNNPDPEQWVGWGDRTVDEMAHLWVDVTYLEREELERLVAERKALEEARTAEGAATPRR